jgi:hypothetical protein
MFEVQADLIFVSSKRNTVTKQKTFVKVVKTMISLGLDWIDLNDILKNDYHS